MFAGCTSLTDASNINISAEVDIKANCFKEMFSDCSGLIKTFQLPKATTSLNESAYEGMFKNCIKLTEITNSEESVFLSTKIAKNCYKEMFAGCTNFQQVLKLPATTLAESCYEGMFKDCLNLKTAPALPATTLAINCYKNMFSGCESLSEIPVLPATSNTYPGSYQEMFSDCIALTNISSLAALSAIVIPSAGYAGMFKGCNRLQKVGNIFNINDNTKFTLSNDCCSGMFEDCYELSDISEFKFPVLMNNNQFDRAFNSMFANCSNLTTLMSSLVYPDYRPNGKFNGGSHVYEKLFDGCSELTETPKLIFPAYSGDMDDYAELLTTQEFNGMFANCTSLSTIYTEGKLNDYLTNDIENLSGFTGWLYNVAETGTFYTDTPIISTYIRRGPDTIPSGWIISGYPEEPTE
jgi:hypothetical protein